MQSILSYSEDGINQTRASNGAVGSAVQRLEIMPCTHMDGNLGAEQDVIACLGYIHCAPKHSLLLL